MRVWGINTDKCLTICTNKSVSKCACEDLSYFTYDELIRRRWGNRAKTLTDVRAGAETEAEQLAHLALKPAEAK